MCPLGGADACHERGRSERNASMPVGVDGAQTRRSAPSRGHCGSGAKQVVIDDALDPFVKGVVHLIDHLIFVCLLIDPLRGIGGDVVGDDLHDEVGELIFDAIADLVRHALDELGVGFDVVDEAVVNVGHSNTLYAACSAVKVLVDGKIGDLRR
jgi:hypothetical protein